MGGIFLKVFMVSFSEVQISRGNVPGCAKHPGLEEIKRTIDCPKIYADPNTPAHDGQRFFGAWDSQRRDLCASRSVPRRLPAVKTTPNKSSLLCLRSL